MDENALCWSYESEVLRIEAWGNDALRVRGTLTAWPKDEDWALLQADQQNVQILIEDNQASITNGKITAYCTDRG